MTRRDLSPLQLLSKICFDIYSGLASDKHSVHVAVGALRCLACFFVSGILRRMAVISSRLDRLIAIALFAIKD